VSVLLLRLAGPMQSWGLFSRFTERDTAMEPTKSGVIGLVCAALGVPRDADARIVRLAQRLRLGIRVDREGTVLKDYHTVGGGDWPGRAKYGVIKADGAAVDTVVSNRYYLADADFLAGLEGECDILEDVRAALADPRWPLYLGRKSFVPSRPVLEQADLREDALESVLRSQPWQGPKRGESPDRLRLVLECGPEEGAIKMDQPVSFNTQQRRYASRYVRVSWADTAALPRAEEMP